MHDTVQAHRLIEIRKAQGHARQADVAALMGVSQARVSMLESGWGAGTRSSAVEPTMLTKHRENDAHKRDMVEQAGRLNVR
jgi:predicted transcriptional regulator